MGDQDHGLVQGLEHRLEIGLELGPDHRIERAQGFVEEKDFGIQHQSPHQADPLALAAGKLDRIAGKGVPGKAREVREFLEPGLDLGLGPADMARHEGDIGAGVEMGKETAILDHIAHAPADQG